MKKIVGVISLFFLFLSCGKEQNFVPDYPVNYSVTIVEFGISAQNNILLVPNKGVAGLMIVRNNNGYFAFDRCSTVSPEKACAVNPDDGGFTATDPCSGAKYFLTDGSPAKSPAKTSLKRYNVTIAGSTIYVRN